MTTTVNIKGMSCSHCVMAVSLQALKQMTDVKAVNVDLDNVRRLSSMKMQLT